MNYTPEQIDAAVTWWRNALVLPKYENTTPDERDPQAFMASALAKRLGAQLTDQQLDAFADHLRDVLEGHCTHTWTSTWDGGKYPIANGYIDILRVDYDPDVVLHHCGELAGFPTNFFWPWKTTMWLRADGGLRVRHGYGAEIEELIPASVPT